MNDTDDIVTRRERSADDVSLGEPIVVMPGINADVERLAAFRAALERKFRCLIPRYLPWYRALQVEESLTATIEDVIRQIVPQLDGRPVTLVGYSFGGLIAHEVARALAAQGIVVKVLAILDTDATHRTSPPSIARLERRKRPPRGDARESGLDHAVALRLAHHLTFGALRSGFVRRMLAWYRRSFRLPLPPSMAAAFDHKMSARVRELTARAWSPSTHDVPTVIFRCSAQSAPTPRDLGWSAYVPVVGVIDVGGTHNSMVTGPHGRRLAESLEQMLAALPNAR